MPPCAVCPFPCHSRFVLFDNGEIRPWKDELPPSTYEVFFGCPKPYLKTTVPIGLVHGSVVEAVKWEWEKGTHKRRNLGVGASLLLRVYNETKDLPKQLVEHIEVEKLRRESKG